MSPFHHEEREKVGAWEKHGEEMFSKSHRIITFRALRETYDPQVITPVLLLCILCTGLQFFHLDL